MCNGVCKCETKAERLTLVVMKILLLTRENIEDMYCQLTYDLEGKSDVEYTDITNEQINAILKSNVETYAQVISLLEKVIKTNTVA